MKKCPFCAEKIKDEAIKCKLCGSELKNEYTNTTKQISIGIKKVESDKIAYNISVFLSMLAGAFFGSLIGFYSSSAKWGWISGITITVIFGVVAANKYFKE